MKNKVINLFNDQRLVQNKGVKYSELLEQFIAPFANDFANSEDFETIIEFAMNAWNIANMKVLLPEEGTDNAINSVEGEDINFDLLNRMIDYKIVHFKTYTNFIIDFELKETSADPILSVITQEEDAFFATMAENFEAEQNEDDFEENYINRTAITIKPYQPFMDWINNLYPDEDFADDDNNIYLIDEDIEVEAWVKKKFDKLFMLELDVWHTNKKEWPKRRNYKMFKQWFQVEISTMVYDLEKYPISKF